MGLCLSAVVIAPKVGWQPACFAPLLKLRWYSAELSVFLQAYISGQALTIQKVLAVVWLVVTPITKCRMRAGSMFGSSGSRAAKAQSFFGVGAPAELPGFWPAEPRFVSVGTALPLLGFALLINTVAD